MKVFIYIESKNRFGYLNIEKDVKEKKNILTKLS
jgi:hypothetical protein